MSRLSVLTSSLDVLSLSSLGRLSCLPCPSAILIGFSVKCEKALLSRIEAAGLTYLSEPVIYRLVETVSERAADLLPKIKETHVLGEALVQQLFEIRLSGGVTTVVAGCRVNNGSISRKERVRIIRGGPGGKEVHEGE